MGFHIPEENYYTKDHEWAQVDENIVTVGITEFAHDQLGEITGTVTTDALLGEIFSSFCIGK